MSRWDRMTRGEVRYEVERLAAVDDAVMGRAAAPEPAIPVRDRDVADEVDRLVTVAETGAEPFDEDGATDEEWSVAEIIARHEVAR